MQRLYQFFQLFKEYIIVAALLIVSLILLSQNDNPQVRHIRAFTVGMIGAVQSALSFIPNIVSLQKENEVLRQLNVNLADEVNQLREAKLETMRLRSMIALKETSSTQLIAATIVGKNLNLLRNTLTLNAGSDDGVRAMMPVISGEGLVGRIIAVSAHYAVAQMVLNVDFRASAKDQRSRVDGIIAWDGNILRFQNVAKTLDVRIGDAIITSEYSDAFPEGIKIGVVSAVEEAQGSLFKTILVAPAVNFVMTEEVFVLNFVPDVERMQLEEKVQRQ
ncbi:MAG: rod shape-determining protein MreC [Bacteroidota bacterium]|nr:rod shape-determining protein MreC [Bacteroidota bacterium]